MQPPPTSSQSGLQGLPTPIMERPCLEALSIILNPTLPPNPPLQSCHPEIVPGPQKAKQVPCSARNALP